MKVSMRWELWLSLSATARLHNNTFTELDFGNFFLLSCSTTALGWAWYLSPSVCIVRWWELPEISSSWLTPSTLTMILINWRNKQWLTQPGYDLSFKHQKWERVVRGQNCSTSWSTPPYSLKWRKLTKKGLCWNGSEQDILRILSFIK